MTTLSVTKPAQKLATKFKWRDLRNRRDWQMASYARAIANHLPDCIVNYLLIQVEQSTRAMKIAERG